jgi:hypothetical protein
LATLNWTVADSDGILFSRGKHDYYVILVRGIPEERPRDCIVELYVTFKEITIFEIKAGQILGKFGFCHVQSFWGNCLP